MFFVCKRRRDEMEARRAGETTEPSSEGAMWCVPGARFFMPGWYAICLGVTRDSNLSISSATASRWLLWSFSTRPQPEQEQKQNQAQLWPFCICWLLQLPSGHGNRAKGQSPTPTIPAPTPIAAYGRQQAAISCPLESRRPGPIDGSSSGLPAHTFHLSPLTFSATADNSDLNGNCCQRIRHTFAHCRTMGKRASGHGPSPSGQYLR